MPAADAACLAWSRCRTLVPVDDGNASAAGGQILLDLTRAVCGM
jgi:hypothetical protein